MIYLFKRILLPFLCAAVLCGAVMGIAVSADETEFTYCPLPEVSYVNPLYADILTEEDILTAPVLNSTSGDETIVYLSYEEAVDELRQKLIGRENSFYINVYLESPSSDEVTGIINNLFADARVHTGNPKEGDTIMWQWATINCKPAEDECRYVGGDYYFDLPFVFTYYTTAEQEAVVDAAVETLKTEIFTDGMTDFETVKAAYDWICKNVRYDYTNLNNTSYKLKYSAYAALIDKTAVCQGYALLMYRLMLEMDIDCRLIPGDGGGAHAWNIVELDNVYYNLDATWDEGTTPESHEWFLLNQASFVRHTRYNNNRYGYYDTEEFHAAYPMAAANYFSDEDIRSGGTLDEESGVRWELTYGGTLIISGEGAMPDFTQTDENGYLTIQPEYLPWNALCERITKIVVKPGITSLGDGAFFASVNAVSAEIADTVTEIGHWAFADCYALQEIEIPANVTSLGYQSFAYCSSLTEIRFLGNAPQFNASVFTNTTATAYYPAGDATWTTDVLQNYGGTIAWTAAADLSADIDGSGAITIEDVFYLLRHTILPARYPIAAVADADINGDGSITVQDAVTLLSRVTDTGN